MTDPRPRSRPGTVTPMPTGHRPLWDSLQTGEFLGLSANTVSRMARRGELPSFMVGQRRRFDPIQIEQYVARRSA